MNTQEAYDAIVAHFSQPGVKLGKNILDPGSACGLRYTQKDGSTAKCAVGCLIPDELYRQSMEGGFEQAWVVRHGLDSLFPPEDANLMGFLADAQVVHDSPLTKSPEQFLARLKERVEGRYGLVT